MDDDELEVIEVDPVELMAEVQAGEKLLLLDVREPWEWKLEHIPGSKHIPMHQIPSRIDEIDELADVVVICAHGQRSYYVTEYLLRQGFRARSLRGGLAAWPHSDSEWSKLA